MRQVGGIGGRGRRPVADRETRHNARASPGLASTQRLYRIVIRRDARESKDEEWRLANPNARHPARHGERQRGADDRTTAKIFHSRDARALSHHTSLVGRFLCVAVVIAIIHGFAGAWAG